MDLPEKLLLSKIQIKNVYFDKKSIEKQTNIIKEKYKLSASSLLDIYIFFVLTSNKIACKKCFTLSVHKEEWEDKKKYYLDDCSYIDITKIESFCKEEVLNKIRDKSNKFSYVARLSKEKFDQLKLLQNKVKKGFGYSGISEETRNLIGDSLHEADIANKTLKNLGLIQ